MTVERPKPKQLLRPITTGANILMNQSQFLAIIWNLLMAQEKSRVHGTIGFGFASHWLKNWCETFKSIIKCSNRNHVITFDSHLKTALKGMGSLSLKTLHFITNLREHFILPLTFAIYISKWVKPDTRFVDLKSVGAGCHCPLSCSFWKSLHCTLKTLQLLNHWKNLPTLIKYSMVL